MEHQISLTAAATDSGYQANITVAGDLPKDVVLGCLAAAHNAARQAIGSLIDRARAGEFVVDNSRLLALEQIIFPERAGEAAVGRRIFTIHVYDTPRGLLSAVEEELPRATQQDIANFFDVYAYLEQALILNFTRGLQKLSSETRIPLEMLHALYSECRAEFKAQQQQQVERRRAADQENQDAQQGPGDAST